MSPLEKKLRRDPVLWALLAVIGWAAGVDRGRVLDQLAEKMAKDKKAE